MMEESIIELTDFSIICRICLEKCDELISIFTKIFHLEIKSYCEMLKECASVNISENDTLPKNLCPQCCQHLEQSYKLKIRCLSSEQRLQSIVENPQNNIKFNELMIKEECLDDAENDFQFYNNDKNDEYFNFYDSKINYPEVEIKTVIKDEEVEDNFTNNQSNRIKSIDYKLNYKKRSVTIVNYKCIDCEGMFICADKLFDHVKDVHLKSALKCEFCEMDFNSVENYKFHYSGGSRVCKWCLKVCGCIKNFIEHNQIHNVCNKCGKTFNNAAACKNHMQVHQEKGYLCEYCGKSFTDRTHMTYHTRTHTGEKPFQCQLCETKFKDVGNLRAHMRIHSTKKEYECDICKQKYKWSNSLQRHKLAEHSKKEFICNICDKHCKTQTSLRRHQIVHSGEWKHICTYCNKSYNRSDNLRVHLRTHTGEKPFVCNKCGKGFTVKIIMKGHMKTCNIKNNII